MLQLLLTFISSRIDREHGATMVEYGLLIALISVVVAIAAQVLGVGLSTLYADVESSL